MTRFRTDTRHAPMPCPVCHAPLDAVEAMSPGRAPHDGDATFCAYCRAFLIYEGTPLATLRLATQAELDTYARESEDFRRALRRLHPSTEPSA